MITLCIFCIFYLRKYSSLPWYKVQLEKNILFNPPFVFWDVWEQHLQKLTTKKATQKKGKQKSWSLWYVPFLSSVTSLEVVSGDFFSSSTRFFQCLALGLPQFLEYGNNLPWSAVGSPCKAQQGPAWSPTQAQARLLTEDSNHHRNGAHESPLSSFSTSWASIAWLFLFLKEHGPWTREIGSVAPGGSRCEPLHGGKHFGAVFFEEVAKAPASPSLIWNAVWQWHLGSLLFIPFLFNQPGPGCLHGGQVMTWRSGTLLLSLPTNSTTPGNSHHPWGTHSV